MDLWPNSRLNGDHRHHIYLKMPDSRPCFKELIKSTDALIMPLAGYTELSMNIKKLYQQCYHIFYVL